MEFDFFPPIVSSFTLAAWCGAVGVCLAALLKRRTFLCVIAAVAALASAAATWMMLGLGAIPMLPGAGLLGVLAVVGEDQTKTSRIHVKPIWLAALFTQFVSVLVLVLAAALGQLAKLS